MQIGAKIKQIVADKTQISRLAKKSAQGIVYNKKQDRFYEQVYHETYSKEALEQKRFLNFGPGNFRHGYWLNVDKVYDDGTWGQARDNNYVTNIDVNWDIYDGEQIDVDDSSIEIIYSSHVIEHIWNKDSIFLFREFRRLLKSGGVLRLVTPDCDWAVDCWERDDWAYLAEYYWRINKRDNFKSYFPIARNRTAFYLLDQFSLVTTKENSTYVSPAESEKFVSGYGSVYEALDAASELSDFELNKKLGKHVNWFNYCKLKTMLLQAGFSSVYRSEFGKSKAAVLRDARHFDKTDPSMSLYVEAVC